MADASAKTIDPRWAWQFYRPSKETPWDLQRVGHLYRRAAFGANHTELEAGLKAGPETFIDRLLKGGSGLAEFDAEMEPLAASIARYNDATHLRAWWLTRMLHSPHPLQEKMTLFWHNHFATSYAKVQSARFMLSQYELMRRHALGNFAELLRAMSTDPAMLIWLDGRDSKKGNPNENYAREVMELFSLGVGNYTEKDIREAARAFTGWEIQGIKVIFNKSQHDDGAKTVLGQTGNWKADDIVRICLEQKSAPSFLVSKLYRFLISETVPATPELLAPLAERFKKSGHDFGALVQTMLSSNLFFSPLVYRTRVKAPVDFVLGIVRGLEGKIGTTALAQTLEQLGQNIFSPPSVKGWDGGRTWLNGQTLLFRQNLALALTSTEDARFGRRTDPAALARKYDKKTDTEVVDFFLRLFLQGDVPAESRAHLLDYQARSHKLPAPVYWTEQDAADHRVRTLCHLVLSLPEFQLD
ncbi:MAG TPA: DUF1800 domain-containing protein [Gemmataceae bacterium]